MALVAVLGYGTVGSGVVETLNTNDTNIELRSGEPVKIKYILDRREFPDDPMGEYIVKDFDIILNDNEVSVVAEVLGGIEPAFTFTKQCLLKGKSVVTSNKELVAKHGAELLEIAKSNNVNYMFEASVGGGIPIIRPLNQSLTAEDIYEISGILNGTTNYILTKMKKDGMSFDDALKLAQDKGYAEKNPDADVLGYDACRKIAILSSLALCKQVDSEDLYTEGITKVTVADMEYAEKINCCVKLIGRAKKTEEGFYAMVSPLIISSENPLSNVDGVFNAILVKGNIIGDVMFYGKGAGKLPTASAVVSDIIECIKHFGKNLMCLWSREKVSPLSITDIPSKFFIRFKISDYEKQITKLNSCFDNLQTVTLEKYNDEFGIVTEVMTETALKSKLAPYNDAVINIIRAE